MYFYVRCYMQMVNPHEQSFTLNMSLKMIIYIYYHFSKIDNTCIYTLLYIYNFFKYKYNIYIYYIYIYIYYHFFKYNIIYIYIYIYIILYM